MAPPAPTRGRVLEQGKELPLHAAPGEITVQCLEGRVAFTCHGATKELRPRTLLYLTSNEPRALQAHEASVHLVTMLLPRSHGQPE